MTSPIKVEKGYHTPAMVEEVLEGLVINPAGIYVDVTLGGGGHTEAILKAASPGGHVIGLDQDIDAIEAATKRLKHYKDRVAFVESNFSDLSRALDARAVTAVDGILADLGVSTHQLDVAERGFSFRKNGPLDMRMDQDADISAMELIKSATELELADWFYRYGEERYSRRIARHICQVRRNTKIEDTATLAQIVKDASPAHARGGRIHPATRVFQALRIVVNAELKNLEMFLSVAPRYLKSKGRLVVISYHSLEDRIVKECFKALNGEGYQIITKKPLVPSSSEVRKNPSARSAKLRVLERI